MNVKSILTLFLTGATSSVGVSCTCNSPDLFNAGGICCPEGTINQNRVCQDICDPNNIQNEG